MRATILHTNDVHSHFDNWSRLCTLLELQRQEDGPVFYVDAGDHGDRSQLDTELTQGFINIDLLQAAGVDGFTPGNNETVVWSLGHLERMARESSFPWLLANVARAGKRPPMDGFAECVLMRRQGVTLGLFGLTSPFEVFLSEMGGTCFEEIEVARQLTRRLRSEGADIVAALSHLGVYRDRQMAQEVEGLDLIIGGHTHTELPRGEHVAGTLIVQTGGFRRPALGRVVIEGTPGDLTLEATILPVEGVPKHPATARLLEERHREVMWRAREDVINLPYPLGHDPLGRSDLAKMLAADLRGLFPQADAGLVQGGVLTQGLPSGPVTRGDLLRVCPTMLNPVLVTVTGRGILDLIEESLDPAVAQARPFGGGMRGGGVVGALYSDALSWRKDPVQVFLDEWPLDPDRHYRIATDDYIGFWTPGRVFQAWRDSPEVAGVKHELSVLVRDVFREGLKSRFATSA